MLRLLVYNGTYINQMLLQKCMNDSISECSCLTILISLLQHLREHYLFCNPRSVPCYFHREVSVDISSQTLFLSAIDSLVIDEADLILSYGHDNDVRQIFSGGYLSKVHQSFLMSATMTEDVEMLKGLTLRNPVSMTAFSLDGVWKLIVYPKAILKVEETAEEAASLSQYVVRCSEVDKFLLTYVILKLKLVHGKCILFVSDVERCYRLKLFLEQFSIKSCVLNSELPLNSRHICFFYHGQSANVFL